MLLQVLLYKFVTKREDSLAIVRCPTSSDVEASALAHDGTALDRNHIMVAEKLASSAAFRAVESNGMVDAERIGEIATLNIAR